MQIKRIISQIEQLRADPDPDLTVFEDAASLLREANDVALEHGVDICPVSRYATPAAALAAARRIAQAISPERFLTVPEAAEVLRVSPDKVTKWIQVGRLQTVNVADVGKRPQHRIAPADLRQLAPAVQTKKARRFL